MAESKSYKQLAKDLIKRTFGFWDRRFLNKREIDRLESKIEKTLELRDSSEIKNLSEEAFAAKTEEFKRRFKKNKVDLIAAGKSANEAHEEALNAILPEAFAVMSEATYRQFGFRPHPEQILGGIILHQGRVAEMKTGEGKTNTVPFPAYLNAITGDPVHIVTTSDTLAEHAAKEMKPLFKLLGMATGLVKPRDSFQGLGAKAMIESKQEAYAADITYVTNYELGFDYLRDNTAKSKDDLVLRAPIEESFAIIDEADSILIDAARNPLRTTKSTEESKEEILAEKTRIKHVNDFVAETGPFIGQPLEKLVLKSDEPDPLDPKTRIYTFEDGTGKYLGPNEVAKFNQDYDYIVNEKSGTATLTTRGEAKAEKAFALNHAKDSDKYDSYILYYIPNALKAHNLYELDQDYVIKRDKIVLVNEFTGYPSEGSRIKGGLHEAFEAKHNLPIQTDGKTLGAITYQNFIRKYRKKACTTGTAKSNEQEFKAVYGQDVVVVPTHNKTIRQDKPDIIYRTEAAKFKAIVAEIVARQDKHHPKHGQPMLIGTTHVDKTEKLDAMIKEAFKAKGIPLPKKYNVLNAKQNAEEAAIIAQAGQFGAITIATNMAGRGTDILLGGNAKELTIQDMKAGAKAFVIKEMEKLGFKQAAIDLVRNFSATEYQEFLQINKAFYKLHKKYLNYINTSAANRKLPDYDTFFAAYNVFDKQRSEKIEQTNIQLYDLQKESGLTLDRARALQLNLAKKLALKEMEKLGYKPDMIDFVAGFDPTDYRELLQTHTTFYALHDEHKKNIEDEKDKDGNIIKLGEKSKAKALGGLCVIGTERHESKRIDDQLIGRAGRQGDPGESQFYLSLEDDLIKTLGDADAAERYRSFFDDDDKPTDIKLVLPRLFKQAQERAESNNFASRERTLKFDIVLNEQRELIYGERNKVLNMSDAELEKQIIHMIKSTVKNITEEAIGSSRYTHEWDWSKLAQETQKTFGIDLPLTEEQAATRITTPEQLENTLTNAAIESFEKKKALLGNAMIETQRSALLESIDANWQIHLDDMDHLKMKAGLQAYAEKKPEEEYRFMAADVFDNMIKSIQSNTVQHVAQAKPKRSSHAPVAPTNGLPWRPLTQSLNINRAASKAAQSAPNVPINTLEKTGTSDRDDH